MLKLPGCSFGAFRRDKSIHNRRFVLSLTLVGVGQTTLPHSRIIEAEDS